VTVQGSIDSVKCLSIVCIIDWVSDHAASEPRLRIGELSQRVGESPTLLRAWERRYHLLDPVRSSGGYRLYGAEDERRVRAMQELLATGVSARQAAEAVLAAPRVTHAAADLQPAAEGASLAASQAQLGDALASYDESAAHTVLDRLFAGFTIETVISQVIVPYLVDLGERWAAGTATIAQEHFATSLIRGRLLGLARGWDSGTGRRALLACPTGELHDLGLLCFGIALRGRGWRITYLGANTPTQTLLDAANRLHPDLIALAATAPARLRAVAGDITGERLSATIAVAGRGASPRIAKQLHAVLLPDDPVTAADRVARGDERARSG
jgi:MerR family transcriptional regulator, light-induced transcriptional regulator